MKANFTLLLLVLLLFAALWIFGGQVKEEDLGPSTLIATLIPTKDNKTNGIVKIYRVKEGVKIIADVQGLSLGAHGFHIHKYGDLSNDTGANVGPHYGDMSSKTESSGQSEGSEGSGSEGSNKRTRPDGRPLGDMKMLVADDSGKAHMEMVIHGLTTQQLVGRSILVHAHEDRLEDGKWNSGPKVSMGVIGIAKTE